MLRVTQALELRFKKADSTISVELVKGFVLALAFHLVCYFCFSIARMQHIEKNVPLRPIAVEVDLGEVRVVSSPNSESFQIPQRATGFPSCVDLYSNVLCPESLLTAPLIERSAPTLLLEGWPYQPLGSLLEEEDD